jgi:hypothetical protein
MVVQPLLGLLEVVVHLPLDLMVRHLGLLVLVQHLDQVMVLPHPVVEVHPVPLSSFYHIC